MLILQETHSEPNLEQIWKSEWGGEIVYSHGTSAARGVAILVSKQIYSNISEIVSSEDGRYIMLDYEENGQKITILAVYAPNEDSPKFFTELDILLKERNENKILIGDFNLTLDVEKDRKNTYNNNNKAKQVLVDTMDHYNLNEMWRILNPEALEYSWFKGNKTKKASRIDYALVSAGLDQKVLVTKYIPGIKTDHRAFYMCIELNPNERGRGYWKLNTKYLQDLDYLQLINQEIEQTLVATEIKSPTDRWEILKERIRKVSQQYCRKVGSENRLIISQLLEKVDEMESRFPLEENETDLLEKTKLELDEKLLEKAKGNIFRSKVRWYEEGEKNTKYFYALEKARYNAKTCYKLINERGQEFVESSKILEEQRKFYENLYAEDKYVNFNLTNTYNIKVPEGIREDQDNQITVEELGIALKGMNNNKTPGEDGLSADFYKAFWGLLKQPMIEMLEESFQVQMLHESALKGVLNLIPKPGKDSRFIKNLRPITLLNTDYKIIEKAVANKMMPALKNIINPDQRGFMKDRRISVNIRKMLDIMHQAEQDDLEAVVLSLDFVKCFDKCSFKILHGSLDFFGFGRIVKEWTTILYKGFSVKVQNNGHFSDKIMIEKGVHQGGCCSSIYFFNNSRNFGISSKREPGH